MISQGLIHVLRSRLDSRAVGYAHMGDHNLTNHVQLRHGGKRSSNCGMRLSSSGKNAWTPDDTPLSGPCAIDVGVERDLVASYAYPHSQLDSVVYGHVEQS